MLSEGQFCCFVVIKTQKCYQMLSVVVPLLSAYLADYQRCYQCYQRYQQNRPKIFELRGQKKDYSTSSLSYSYTI